MAIAFFDLDRTLLAANSASLWLAFERRAGRVRASDVVRALYWLLMYHLGAAKMDQALEQSAKTVTGVAESDLIARVEQFYATSIHGGYRPGGLGAIAQHRARGDRVVLLTSAAVYLADRVQQDLELDDRLCSRYEVDGNGRMTGRPVFPLCFGPGKIGYATRYAEEKGIDMSQCTFYTDSVSDVPMLELVGHPVAVNPDPRLRREAKRRRWPVVDWGQPI